MSDSGETALHPQFVDMEQQRETAEIGMWVFLLTEIMFFGGLFCSYAYYRYLFHGAFAAASTASEVWLGGTNTAVLLISSLTMALAVHSAKQGDRKALVRYLLLTWVLGAAFVGIKAIEYHHHFEEHLFPGPNFHFDYIHPEQTEMFFYLYFAMTATHALHMLIGLGVVAWLIILARRGRFSPQYYNPVEITGLYWHFVDIVWLYLFPLLYLVNKK